MFVYLLSFIPSWSQYYNHGSEPNPIFEYPNSPFLRLSSYVSAYLGHAAFGPQGLHVSCTPEPLGHSIKDHTGRAVFEARLLGLPNLGVKWKNKEDFLGSYLIFWEKESDF